MIEQTCQDHEHRPQDSIFTRRQFLNRLGMGFGALSLTSLVGMGILSPPDAIADSFSPYSPKSPPFPPKAKRVIHIFASGAPSHLDTWDPKPALQKLDEKPMPDDKNGTVFASPFKFKKMGQSGTEVSEVFPLLGQHVDDMCIVRSMYTDIPDHIAASLMMNTGSVRLPKPSVGSWVTYGLGSENQNLPAFIALSPGGVSAQNLRSAFLPGAYQGTSVNTQYTSIDKLIENIKNKYTSLPEQRKQLDLLHQLNEVHSQNLKKDAQLEARLQAYELAYQMQMEASDAFDISKEPADVRAMYGDNTQTGRQMLIARRLLEKGVRFVQVWHGGWDHHTNLETNLAKKAEECDKPLAALLTDLKQRGMLKDTLVVWGGEFGRSPTADGNIAGGTPGRTHNNKAFSIWMAGGGVKGGMTYGATDEFGARAVENKVHIHDLHATMLKLLGFDHEKLTYRYNGRDFRLTDVFGNVVKEIIA
ncbi:DUF1501 domain-containing protein [Pedosphaera parvula]|uniref:Sulfatase n=1 Tax=Pedosphaera parvula (strain Ellin514) TaxID=320771 RepID=B9XB21_PEDPL|nr:protein of unknown function DUF1501 [Pedosphaera parvula Ellin514]